MPQIEEQEVSLYKSICALAALYKTARVEGIERSGNNAIRKYSNRILILSQHRFAKIE
jgi:hypothetical protein